MKDLSVYFTLPFFLIFVWMYIMFVTDNVYRYPCHDPANWGKSACETPRCEADGTCTKYLITLEEEPRSGKQ
jgi:hypothetical protein